VTVPYTIRLLEETPSPAAVLAELRKRLATVAPRFMLEREEIKNRDILLPAIRLKEPRPYHDYLPGAKKGYDQRRGKPRNRRIPEHDDWVEFNNLVNDVLDHFETTANVFSKPWGNHLLWIRKGGRRREKYDSMKTKTRYGDAVSVNPGTDDQFGGDVRLKYPDLSEV
jgi:hypothetical protein